MRSTVAAVLWITAAATLVVIAAEAIDLFVGGRVTATPEPTEWSVGTAVAGLVRVGLLGGIGWVVTGRLLRRRAVAGDQR